MTTTTETNTTSAHALALTTDRRDEEHGDLEFAGTTEEQRIVELELVRLEQGQLRTPRRLHEATLRVIYRVAEHDAAWRAKALVAAHVSGALAAPAGEQRWSLRPSFVEALERTQAKWVLRPSEIMLPYSHIFVDFDFEEQGHPCCASAIVTKDYLLRCATEFKRQRSREVALSCWNLGGENDTWPVVNEKTEHSHDGDGPVATCLACALDDPDSGARSTHDRAHNILIGFLHWLSLAPEERAESIATIVVAGADERRTKLERELASAKKSGRSRSAARAQAALDRWVTRVSASRTVHSVGSEERGEPTKRRNMHWVAGHWHHYLVGAVDVHPRNRRLRWVRPFLRGSEGAPPSVRAYAVGGPA